MDCLVFPLGGPKLIKQASSEALLRRWREW